MVQGQNRAQRRAQERRNGAGGPTPAQAERAVREAQAAQAAQMQAQAEKLQGEIATVRESNQERIAELGRNGLGVQFNGVEVRALVKMVSGGNPLFMLAWEMQVEQDVAAMLDEAETPETMAKVREMQLTQGVAGMPVVPAGQEEAVARQIVDQHGGVVLGGPGANGAVQ